MQKLFPLAIVAAVIAAVGYFAWDRLSGSGSGLSPSGALAMQAETVRKVVNAEIDSDPAGEAEMRRLAEILADDVLITLGDVSGGTVRNVRLSLVEYPDVAVTIDRLEILGLNLDGIEAAMNGAEWTELRAADRIDAGGIEVVGYGEFLDKMMAEAGEIDPSNGIVASSEEMPELTNVRIGAGRWVTDGMTFFPGLTWDDYVASDPTLTGWDLASRLAKNYLTYKEDYSRIEDAEFSFDMDMSDPAMGDIGAMTIKFSIGSMSSAGWDRADLDYSVATDLGYEFLVSVPVPDGDAIELSMAFGADGFGIEGLRLSQLFETLAERKIPSTAETDIMSLGKWSIEGQSTTLNGEAYTTTEMVTVDLSDFHWLLPTALDIEVKGLVYDLEALFALAENIVNDLPIDGDAEAAEIAEMMSMMGEGLDVLRRQDLSAMTFDGRYALSWNPDDGRFAGTMKAALRGDISFDSTTDGVFPTYADVVGIMGPDSAWPDEEALLSLMEEKAGLVRYRLDFADTGLVDKVYTMIPQFAALVPEGTSPQAEQLAKQSPDQIKTMVGALIRVGVGQAASAFPPAKSWGNALAEFVTSGGTFSVVIEPEEPLGMKEVIAMEASGPDLTPEMIVETLGIEITHAPAP